MITHLLYTLLVIRDATVFVILRLIQYYYERSLYYRNVKKDYDTFDE